MKLNEFDRSLRKLERDIIKKNKMRKKELKRTVNDAIRSIFYQD